MGTIYEGTWDEIAKHADELRGKQLRLTVIDNTSIEDWNRPLTDEEKRKQQEAIDAFFDELDKKRDTFKPPVLTKPDPYGDALIEKYRKQGLNL